MTPYSTIYEKFLRNIEDVDLPKFTTEEQKEILLGYMEKALSIIDMESPTLDSDLNKRDDLSEQFEQTLKPYEIELIVLFMIVAWYEPKINSLQTTTLLVGGKDEKWTNQKQHLDGLMAASERVYLRARKLIRNKNYKRLIKK